MAPRPSKTRAPAAAAKLPSLAPPTSAQPSGAIPIDLATDSAISYSSLHEAGSSTGRFKPPVISIFAPEVSGVNDLIARSTRSKSL